MSVQAAVARVGFRQSPWLVTALASLGIMAAAQILIPLSDERAGLSVLTVVGLFGGALGLAAHAWGGARAVLAAGAVVVVTTMVEWVGSTTGVPFGRYTYTGVLQPEVLGVPVIVPLAWFGMGAPAWELAGRVAARPLARMAVGALALAAWDVFLDPQMVTEGFWRWEATGSIAWQGIPLVNYLGWIGASFGVMGLFAALVPSGARSLPLLGIYAWTAVMETIGFLFFFDDPLVGVVGGVCMGLPLAAALRRTGLGPRPG